MPLGTAAIQLALIITSNNNCSPSFLLVQEAESPKMNPTYSICAGSLGV